MLKLVFLVGVEFPLLLNPSSCSDCVNCPLLFTHKIQHKVAQIAQTVFFEFPHFIIVIRRKLGQRSGD